MRRTGPIVRRCAALVALLLGALLGWLPTARAATGVAASGATVTVAAAPTSATAQAVAAAQAGGLRVAVAVLDTTSGTTTGTTSGTTTVAGETAALFPSESVVKVLVAARLLSDGLMTGEVEQQATAMLTASDDDAANSLWGLVGGPDVVAWAADHYGIADLGEAPSEWGWWGNTKLTAQGLVALYAAIAADPVAGQWIVARLTAITPIADDGTDQTFGLAQAAGGTATGTVTSAVKQGWGGDDDSESTANLLSTGLLDGSRYAVAVVVQDPDGGSAWRLTPTVDALADAVVADLTAQQAAEAAAAADATADDEAATPPAAPGSPAMGGASARAGSQAWWPASVGVLGGAGVLAALTVAVSVVRQRRATARPS